MIRLEYLSHSSFLLTCGNKKIVFDPWLAGSAYFNQWYLWPVYPGDLPLSFDVILVSHGHEDHLHAATLKRLDKKAKIFFPFQWRKGIRPFLNSLGYNDVTEAVTFTTYEIDDVKITYVGYSLESVVVVEYDGCVVVNINDALNSNHRNVVDYILEEIKSRWPDIDYLLSGWSGAGYFPNQVKYKDKDDIEIAKLREQYFANNFCLFTKELNPRTAIPFVPGFVLLRKGIEWINHIKFPRRQVASYYESNYGAGRTKFIVPYPGDIIDDGNFQQVSSMHDISEEEVTSKAFEFYSDELRNADNIQPVSEGEIDKLLIDLSRWINYNKRLYSDVVLRDAIFSIELEDIKENKIFNVNYSKGEFIVERSSEISREKKLVIRTSAKMLTYALKKVWGGDVITIGYGLEIELYDTSTLEKNLDIVCTRLITRYPMIREDFFRFPLRAVKYYLSNPGITSLWIKQKMTLKPYVNKFPFNERDHWFTYNKCDLCAVCRMPEVDIKSYNDFALNN